MSQLVVTLVVDNVTPGQAIGIKEAIAMDLEKYGDARVLRVDVREPEQLNMGFVSNRGENAMKISCSRCGADKEFRYSAGNVLCTVYTQGWNSYGAALYCPECSATWDERNKGRPMAGPENTIGLIDEFYRRSKRRYSP